jgi:spore coat protein U-like protein
MAGSAPAASPSGFSTTTISLNAQVNTACQEAQHGTFPNPITIDTLAVSDQIFSPTVDETVKCTNGTLFTIKVSSANGAALNQTCTSGGVSAMALKSAGTPADTIAYTFMCAGDTDGAGNFTGAGFATAKALGISVKVLTANAQAAVAHADYSDTVTLTISY